MFKVLKFFVFDDVYDGMDSFLFRFERYVEVWNWGEENWVIKLSVFLWGKVLDVYVLMFKIDVLIY